MAEMKAQFEAEDRREEERRRSAAGGESAAGWPSGGDSRGVRSRAFKGSRPGSGPAAAEPHAGSEGRQGFRGQTEPDPRCARGSSGSYGGGYGGGGGSYNGGGAGGPQKGTAESAAATRGWRWRFAVGLAVVCGMGLLGVGPLAVLINLSRIQFAEHTKGGSAAAGLGADSGAEEALGWFDEVMEEGG